ncbi:MAG TPA: ATP-dependent DNA helicase, partial [Acidiferrobacteraceae bacterium]|nr:ATP-dependent DNA helicase [Acidiferrobacteraceae bacterium]
EEGFTRLLPATSHVVFDEAHQLPAIAGGFFGSSFASRSLRQWGEALEHADRLDSLALDRLGDRLSQLRQLLGQVTHLAGDAGTRTDLSDAPPELATALTSLSAVVHELVTPLVAAGARSERSLQALRQGQRLQQALVSTLAPDASQIAWLEASKAGFSVHRTPAIAGPEFRQVLGLNGPGPRPAYVFLSATLSVDGDFSYFQRMLDLEDMATGRWETGFDYKRQALLYLPPGIPDPRAADFLDGFIDCVVPVLEASQGRAFLLFTTHRVLRQAHAALERRIRFPLLVQGTLPRARLLERFRSTPNAVLLGTASFWEGIDVAGAALSCVVIDKLPFAPPHDPLERARLQLLKAEGVNGFRDYQLPRAVLALKQGVGRLIRTSSDRGVVVLCDPRVQTQPYGKLFLASLPPMPVTGALSQVQQFFEESLV